MRSPLLPLSVCLPSVDSRRQTLTAKSISLGRPDMSDRSRLAYSLGRPTSFGRPSISRVDSTTSLQGINDSTTLLVSSSNSRLTVSNYKCVTQCFPTFFQPWHIFLEPLTRQHTAFMALNLYTRLTYDA